MTDQILEALKEIPKVYQEGYAAGLRGAHFCPYVTGTFESYEWWRGRNKYDCDQVNAYLSATNGPLA